MLIFPTMYGIIGRNSPSASFIKGTYTGNATNRSFSGFGFSPNITLARGANAGTDWNLQSTNLGTTVALATNGNNPAATGQTTRVTSFDSDGYSIGTSSIINAITQPFIYFAWDIVAGFAAAVNFTGTGSAHTENHTLGVAPDLILVKNTTGATNNWAMYCSQNDNTSPQNYAQSWSATVSRQTSATYWNNTAPTSSVFTVGTNADVNNSGDGIAAYLFATLAGASKIGRYTGNGSNTGPIITLDFTPSMVMILRQVAAANNFWVVYGNNLNTKLNAAAVTDTSNYVDLLTNSFQIKTTDLDFNDNAQTYIYVAFR